MNWVYLDGRILPEDGATVPATSAGLLTGRGVFETFRLRRGRNIFRLGRHYARLMEGARTLGISVALTEDELAEGAAALAGRNGLDDARIRLTLFATKSGEDSFTGTVLMQARANTDYPEELYRAGVSAVISGVRRDESSPISRIKSVNRLAEDFARSEARRRGAFEAILLNTRGCVAEGTMTNVFVVRQGRILTPPVSDGALPGVTRDALLGLAAENATSTSEEPIGLNDLATADEAFLTNAVAGVLPLVRLNDAPLADGLPGPMTRLIRALYMAAIERET